jgi:hypothetical protein
MARAAEKCWWPSGLDGSVEGDGFGLALPTIMRGGARVRLRGGRSRRRRRQRSRDRNRYRREMATEGREGWGGFLLGRAGTGARQIQGLTRRGWAEALANERAGPSGRRRGRTDGERYYKKRRQDTDAEEMMEQLGTGRAALGIGDGDGDDGWSWGGDQFGRPKRRVTEHEVALPARPSQAARPGTGTDPVCTVQTRQCTCTARAALHVLRQRQPAARRRSPQPRAARRREERDRCHSCRRPSKQPTAVQLSAA